MISLSLGFKYFSFQIELGCKLSGPAMASSPDSSRTVAIGKMGNLKQLRSSLRTFVSKSNLSDASVILDKLDKLMDDESEEEMAAMEIQRCFRGHAGRQACQWRAQQCRDSEQGQLAVQRALKVALGCRFAQ